MLLYYLDFYLTISIRKERISFSIIISNILAIIGNEIKERVNPSKVDFDPLFPK